MPATLQTYGIDLLPVSERIALVQEIWDSIAAETENYALTPSQRDEIDRRLASHESNPQAAIPWEQVESEALDRLNR
ncbi:MAG: addiction module protein [Candidatus Methylumidiphilus sp.]